MGGSLEEFRSCSKALLRHVTGQVRYRRGRKGKHKCWKQSLSLDKEVVCRDIDITWYVSYVSYDESKS